MASQNGRKGGGSLAGSYGIERGVYIGRRARRWAYPTSRRARPSSISELQREVADHVPEVAPLAPDRASAPLGTVPDRALVERRIAGVLREIRVPPETEAPSAIDRLGEPRRRVVEDL